jgi:hypothetical protein
MLKNWYSPLHFVNSRHFVNSKNSLLWQKNLPMDSFPIQINPIKSSYLLFIVLLGFHRLFDSDRSFNSHTLWESQIVLFHAVFLTTRHNKWWRVQVVELFTTCFLQFSKCRLTYSSFRTRRSIFSLALKPIFVLQTDLTKAYLDTLLVPHLTGLGIKKKVHEFVQEITSSSSLYLHLYIFI